MPSLARSEHCGRSARLYTPVHVRGEERSVMNDLIACLASRPFVMRPRRSAGSAEHFVTSRRTLVNPGAAVLNGSPTPPTQFLSHGCAVAQDF